MTDLPMIVDSFAGGGGASTGIEMALGRSPDVAINHSKAALALHEANHPDTLHLDSNIWDVDPVEVAKGRKVGLLWASPDCFTAGTLILTDKGYRPIETIEEGDMVLTHTGRFCRVYATMTESKRIVTVDGQGVPTIETTAEHPFYARPCSYVWDNPNRRYQHTLSDPEWVKSAELRTNCAPSNKAGGDQHFWATPAKVSTLPIPNVPGRGMNIDERLMWLAGRYVGDGWSRLTETRGELVIVCNKAEADVLRENLCVWPRKGLRADRGELAWHERETDTEIQFSTNHRGLVQWLRENFGHGAAAKAFPAWTLGADRSMRKALLSGYLSADGWEASLKGVEVCETSTISKALAYSTKTLVETLGMTAQIYGPMPNGRDIIEGRQIASKPIYKLRWRPNPKREQNVRDELHNWTRVQKVTDTGRFAQTFNISVEDDETYIADGIVVHNCKHFSRASGKALKDRNIRDLAWVIVDWAEKVKPEVILMENVEEFQTWGPVGEDGRPVKEFAGMTFELWVKRLKKAGYKLKWNALRGCDYGAPTIRKRFFMVARRDGRPIVWPKPTHGVPKSAAVKKGKLLPWRTAAECIDWSIPCPSIFLTKEEAVRYGKDNQCNAPKRPLTGNTLARIARGMGRYVLNANRPFVVNLTHGGRVEDAADPLKTITGANRGEKAVIAPALMRHFGASVGQSITTPTGTVTAGGGGKTALIAPSITRFNSGATGVAMDEPMPTVTANSWVKKPGGAAPLGVIAPHLMTMRNAQKPFNGADEPAHTITAGGARLCEVAPYLMSLKGSARRDSDASAPHPTVLAGGLHSAVITPALLSVAHGDSGGRREYPLTEPHGTVTSGGISHALFSPILTYAQQGGSNRSCEAPAHTITASKKDQNAVISPLLVQTGYGERQGQAPRSLDPFAPLGTVVAGGIKHAPAAAFLAQHNKAKSGFNPGRPVDAPISTLTMTGSQQSVVAPWFAKYYGTADNGARTDEPLHTVTVKDRFGHMQAELAAPEFGPEHEERARAVADLLRHHGEWDGGEFVTLEIDGQTFVVVDIGMRMLTPRELFNAQGFPADYVIEGVWQEQDGEWMFNSFPKYVQVSCCGNSVCPDVAAALVEANCQHLSVDAAPKNEGAFR